MKKSKMKMETKRPLKVILIISWQNRIYKDGIPDSLFYANLISI